MTSVIGVKHKWLWSVPDEMQVPAEWLTSARRGRAADLRIIFTTAITGGLLSCVLHYNETFGQKHFNTSISEAWDPSKQCDQK